MTAVPPEMTLHEVAEHLDVHYMTVYRYVRLGYLPALKEGGSWRVLRSDVEQLRKVPPAKSHGDRSATRWDERLLQRLLAADQSGSWKVVEAALASGMSVRAVYTEMLTPALREIGARWHQGTVSVAEEHAATQLATRIVSRLAAQASRRGVPKGTVVLGTPAGELHTLPVMIAADLIRMEGFEVLDLGSNLPPESLAEIAAAQQRLVAVGLSVTASGQAEAIAETIAAVRKRVDAPIILGGAAIDGDEHAKLLGADFGARHAGDIIPRLLQLVP